MKSLITLSLLLMSLSSHSGEVVCGKVKASSKMAFPINDLAIQIAQKLDLKTCTGSERYKDAVISGKHSAKVIQVTQEQLKQARKKLLSSPTGKGAGFGKLF